MKIGLKEYREKLLGCWMGKNIGGTLGAPFEWQRRVNNVNFYTQELEGCALPNDDLDIQLLWLIALEEKGVRIDSKVLSEYWMLFVTPHWAEYGTAKINMRSGLLPPLSGSHNNCYKNSCGAFIRSEIWACIAPGRPDIAAVFAFEDAIIDHGDGEGLYAEVFAAALESAAFFEKDIYKLIDISLSYIPADCGVALSVKNVVENCSSGKTWLEARNDLLKNYRGKAHAGLDCQVSAEDHERGFADGELGWDAPSNIGIVVIGLLYGDGDFEKSICTAVNCGEDTDCTAATVGSIFGIINGIHSIPQRWIAPIGESIKTACLNLGELGYFGNQLPSNISNLSERVEKLANQVIYDYKTGLEFVCEDEFVANQVDSNCFYADSKFLTIYNQSKGVAFKFDLFDIVVDYNSNPSIKTNESREIILNIRNRFKTQEMLDIKWYAPDDWNILPAKQGKSFILNSWFPCSTTEIKYTIQIANLKKANRAVIELTIPGKHTVMLVPILFLSNDY